MYVLGGSLTLVFIISEGREFVNGFNSTLGFLILCISVGLCLIRKCSYLLSV